MRISTSRFAYPRRGSRRTLKQLTRELLLCLALPSVLLVGARMLAQSPAAHSDEQIGTEIDQKIVTSDTLRTQNIGVQVQDGVVTLNGTVTDPSMRQQADMLVRSVTGVKSVNDNLTVGAPAPANQVENQDDAEAHGDTSATPPPPGTPPPPPTAEELQGAPPPAPPGSGSEGVEPQGGAVPPAGANAAGQRYSPPPNGYDEHGVQPLVNVSRGTPLFVMMLQTIDSKHTPPGTPFRGVLVQDVMSPTGVVAIPRGAYVDGTVIDARPAGQLKGKPKLALQLAHVDVGAATYPVLSSMWARQGPGKGGNTAATVVGTSAFGAIAGGIVGGGPTALLGAALGGLGGVGLSALSPSAKLVVPAESVITFRLDASLSVHTPTAAERRALSGNVPPAAYRYSPYPPPPPGYGPGPYGGYPPPPPGPPGGYPY